MLIGLVGPSGSHKTAVAKYLRKRHGFASVHAGEPVKRGFRAGFGLAKAHTAGAAKDNPTALLGGANARDVMEAAGAAIHSAAPWATSTVMRRRTSGAKP
jgi:dephospho-CoA kinase